MRRTVCVVGLCVGVGVFAGAAGTAEARQRASHPHAATTAHPGELNWQPLREMPGAPGGAFTTFRGAPITPRTAPYLLGHDRARQRFFIAEAATHRVVAEISRPPLGGLLLLKQGSSTEPVLSTSAALARFFARPVATP
jgi:hypothetical protein